MNSSRSRRSRPPTGRTNLSQLGTTMIGATKTGTVNPFSPTKSRTTTRNFRPFTAESEPSHEETHAARFGHFMEVRMVSRLFGVDMVLCGLGMG